jgi:RNA polymerase sigma-70 factor (ECF subfamily)
MPRHPTQPAEFERLLAAHPGIVAKVAASYCRDPEDRADLAQEIRLQLWRAWPGFDAGRPFSTWMYRIALNVAISHRRRERERHRHDPMDEDHHALVGDGDVDAETRQRLEIVQRAMQGLGALDRALLLLHLEGCSHREAGDVLGIREGNVATRLNRIRQQLRRDAGEQGEPHGTD